ncbi:MAG TPA: dihydrofolate reductase family protein, partial [Pirellulales bacterium]|nr:dihydrofolate reductase family protein [Pirellulales bacterium]
GSDCQLVRTARDSSVIVAASATATAADRQRLEAAGCEVLICAGATRLERLSWLLDEFGRRKMTNVLFEGGSQVFGCLFDLSAIDEVHAFIAPKLIGGQDAPSAIGGAGLDSMARAVNLVSPQIQTCGDDVYVHGRISH